MLTSDMDERNAAYLTREELATLSFLPVWVFYFICLRGLGPQRVSKIMLLRVLEGHADPEGDLSAYLVNFLKSNLHKLYESHFADVDHPNFDRLERDLVNTSDLLLLKCNEQAPFRNYQRFLREFARLVAESPLCDGDVSEESYRTMKVHSLMVQGMLS